MPLYVVQTRKATTQDQRFKWSNQYFMDAPTVSQALVQGLDMWLNFERIFHDTDVYCYEVYCNLQGDAPGSIGYVSQVAPGSQRGEWAATGRGETMPLFNVIRCDYPVVNSRPSRKFWRPLLRVGDFDNGQITAAVTSRIAGAGAHVPTVDFLRDPDNQFWTGEQIIRGITSRRLGREAGLNVPPPPALG